MCFVSELLRENTAVPSMKVLKYNRINFHLTDGKGMTLLYCPVFSDMWVSLRVLFWAFTSPKSGGKKYWLEYDVSETYINPSPTFSLQTEEYISP